MPCYNSLTGLIRDVHEDPPGVRPKKMTFFVYDVILKFYLIFSGEGRYCKLVCSNINVVLSQRYKNFICSGQLISFINISSETN